MNTTTFDNIIAVPDIFGLIVQGCYRPDVFLQVNRAAREVAGRVEYTRLYVQFSRGSDGGSGGSDGTDRARQAARDAAILSDNWRLGEPYSDTDVLLVACRRGLLEHVKRALESGAVWPAGVIDIAAHAAIGGGCLEIVKYIIPGHVSVASDILISTACSGNAQVLQYILSHAGGSESNLNILFDVAIRVMNCDVADYLLPAWIPRAVFSVRQFARYVAGNVGRTAAVLERCRQHGHPQYYEFVYSLVQQACEAGDCATMRLLIEHGHIDCSTDDYFRMALDNMRMPIVALMLDNGAAAEEHMEQIVAQIIKYESRELVAVLAERGYDLACMGRLGGLQRYFFWERRGEG